MSIVLENRLGLFLCGILWQGMLSAAVVTVDFEATITAVTSTSAANSMIADIVVGNKFNGSYTYDTVVPDNQGLVSVGVFDNALTELYINVIDQQYYWHLGDYSGKFTGLVETENGVGVDSLTISSNEPTAVEGSPLVLDASPLNPQSLQYLQLQFTSPDFLTNDAMPIVPPAVSTTASVCLRFDATPLTTACGNGASDVSFDFTVTDKTIIKRLDRYQWANPLPQGSTLHDVIWSDTHKIYVTVGQNGAMATSSNGIGWVNRNVFTKERYNSIAFGNGIYVVITNKDVFSSQDNIVWKSTDSTLLGTKDKFENVIWDGNQFIIVGIHYKRDANNINTAYLLVSTSIDGLNWQQDYPVGKDRLLDVASNGSSIYVGISSVEASRVVKSVNLKTWNPISPLPTDVFFDVIWNGTLFVAVGLRGAIISSVNGVSWFSHSVTGGLTPTLAKITWQDNKFIAVGSDATGGVIVTGTPDNSAGGITWVLQGVPGTAPGFSVQAAAFNGAEHVLVGDKGKILRGSNLQTWQESSTGVVQNFNDAIWTGGEFIAVGNDGTIGTSVNGIDWVFQNLAGKVDLQGISTNADVGNGVHVVVGANGNVYRSTDAKTDWTLVREGRVVNSAINQLNQVLWVVDKFVAVGQNGEIITSPDGNTWTTRSTEVNVEFTDLAVRDNYIVVVGGQGVSVLSSQNPVVMTSSNGIDWQKQIPEFDNGVTGILSVTWSGNEFLAVSNSSFDILRSKDGINWKKYGSNASGVGFTRFSYAKWLGTKYIGFGTNRGTNVIATSPDGIKWSGSYAYFSGEIEFGVATSTDNLIIVSNAGGINYKRGNYSDNLAAYVYAGEDQFIEPGQNIIISATATDSDGTITDVIFKQTSGTTITDTNADNLIIEFVSNTETDYVFTLTATDDKGAVSTDEVLIKVAPNQAPTAVDSGVDQDVISGSAVTMVGAGQDPENRVLSYSWLQISNLQGLIESSVTLVDADKAETRFNAPQTDIDLILSFELTVTDDGGLSTKDVINITVTPKPPAVKPADTKKGGGALFWLLPLLVLAARRRIPDSGQTL